MISSNSYYKLKNDIMKNTIKKLILLTLSLNIVHSCIPTNNIVNFDLKNNTSKLIYNGFSYSFPDTSLKKISNVPNKGYRIFPGQAQATTLGLFSYNPTLQIFIFDADVIEKTPWDTIVKYNMVLKRFQFTESELQKMGYKIIYDGN